MANNRNLHVQLNVNANAKQAQAEMKNLQSILQDITRRAYINVDDSNLKKASTAAQELQQHLNNAFNVDTGKLDLNKFSASLASSKKNIADYKRDLEAIGTSGEQAFLKVAQSIAQADAPLLKANTKLNEFLGTLKNTARWQISSSLLHGFIGSIQTAYGYAQDLNKSLNNIQIVTGQSTQQMAQLAEKANKAAQALSTRTTDYTNAALIYYQQGLGDKEVEKRTETTLKLANVTRQSAEEVSSQMTAIWNNFADGSKELEYYADAITALGAKTASSSSEIAEGLSKFAAIADTIGLSYETAAASIATVVAETRQSADTVGNAFKSIFARIQSLKLGETLEDGVGLTKYTTALETVGVKVLDINGELREADDILNDLGQRWTEISDTQKTALAQTVAGQRQYAQFMALMGNWDKVQANVDVAAGSEGSLEEQQERYASGWEASSKRVRAALENIWNSLVDDKFFINLNNGLTKVLNGVSGLINGLGGLKGILLMVGSFITEKLIAQAPNALNRIKEDLFIITGQAEKLAQKNRADIIESLQGSKNPSQSLEYDMQIEKISTILEMKNKLAKSEGTLTEAQKQNYSILVDQVEKEYERQEALAKSIDEQQQSFNEQKQLLEEQIANKTDQAGNISYFNAETGQSGIFNVDYVESAIDEMIKYQDTLVNARSAQLDFIKFNSNIGKDSGEGFEQAKQKVEEFLNALEESGKVNKNNADWQAFRQNVSAVDGDIKQLKATMETATQVDFKGLATDIDGNGIAVKDLESKFQTLKAEMSNVFGADIIEKLVGTEEDIQKKTILLEQLKKTIDGFQNKGDEILKPDNFQKASQGIGLAAGQMMRFSSLISSSKNFFSTWGDEGASASEKITTSIGFATSALFYMQNVIKITSAAMQSFGGPVGIAIGIAVTAFGALAAAIGSSDAAAKKHQETLKKSAELAKKDADESRERYENAKEEAEKNEELLKAYEDAVKIYEDTGTGKANIIQTGNDLLRAYGLESEAVRILNGDYRGLISTIKAVNDAKLDQTLATGKEALSRAETSLGATARASGNQYNMGENLMDQFWELDAVKSFLYDSKLDFGESFFREDSYMDAGEELIAQIAKGIKGATPELNQAMQLALDETRKIIAKDNEDGIVDEYFGPTFINQLEEAVLKSTSRSYRFSDGKHDKWTWSDSGEEGTGPQTVLLEAFKNLGWVEGQDYSISGWEAGQGYDKELGGLELFFTDVINDADAAKQAYAKITELYNYATTVSEDGFSQDQVDAFIDSTLGQNLKAFLDLLKEQYDGIIDFEKEVEGMEIASVIQKKSAEIERERNIDTQDQFEEMVKEIAEEVINQGLMTQEENEDETKFKTRVAGQVESSLLSTGKYDFTPTSASLYQQMENSDWQSKDLIAFNNYFKGNGIGSEENPVEATAYYKIIWEERESGVEGAEDILDSAERVKEIADEQLKSKNFLIELNSQMDAVENNKFKTGMTSSELADFESSSGIRWGEVIEGIDEEAKVQIKSFDEFLLMTEAQREQYLTTLYEEMSKAREAELDESIEQAEDKMEELNTYLMPKAQQEAEDKGNIWKDFAENDQRWMMADYHVQGEDVEEKLSKIKGILDNQALSDQDIFEKTGFSTRESLQYLYDEAYKAYSEAQAASDEVARLNSEMDNAKQTIVEANSEKAKSLILQKQEEKDLWKELDALDLKAGDILSSKQGKALKDVGLDDYIQELSDGTYRVKSNAEGLIDAIHESRIKIAQETAGESTTLKDGNKQYANQYWTDENGNRLKDEKGNDLKKRVYSKKDQANVEALTAEGVDTSAFNTKELFETPEGFAAYMAALDQHNAKTQEAKAYVGDLVESFADLNALVASEEIEEGSKKWQEYVDYLKETESAASEAKSALDLVNAAGRGELGDRDEALKAYTAAGNTDKFRIGQMQSIYKNTMAEGEEFQFEDFAQWIGENAKYVEASADSLDIWREKFEALGPEGIEIFNQLAASVDLTGKSIKEIEEMDGLPKSLKDKAIQEVRDTLLSTVETLDDLKNVAGELDTEGYLQGLKQLMGDDAIDSSQATAELEKLKEIIAQGGSEAKAAIPIYDELLDIESDGTLTTLDKIERKIQDGIQLASNYSSLIKELSGDKYTENEQLANQKNTRQQIKNDNTVDAELGRALNNKEKADLITSSIQTDISRVKGAEGLTPEEQLEYVKSLHSEYNGLMRDLGQSPAPMVLRQMGSAAADIVKNMGDMSVSDQIKTVMELYGTDPNNMVVAANAIKELLGCDSNDANEQMKALIDALDEGIINATTLKQILTGITQDTSIDPQARLNLLDNNQEEILDTYYQDNYDKGIENGLSEKKAAQVAQITSAKELTQDYQNIVDSLDASSFETPEAFIEFFDKLPEGVDYMGQLTGLFGSIAEKVTSFDQLDKLGELMTANGATDEDFANPENEGWQNAMESARTAEAGEIGVPVEEFRNYEEMIYNVIAAENELGRSEQELQVLSMKMTKSMMDQESGYEDLKSATKKYSQELSDFADGTDTMSMKSNKAITEVQKACTKLFGGKVSRNFVEKNLEDIEKAAEGDIDALKKLQKEAAKDYTQGLKEMREAAGKSTKAIDNLGPALEEAFSDLDNAQIGDDISDNFRKTLNDMIASGEMTASEVEEMLNRMGYDCDFNGITVGMDEATEMVANKSEIMQNYMRNGMDAALAGMSDSAAAQLSNLVAAFEQAGYDEASAMEAALNSVGTQLEVSEEQIGASDSANATSTSTFDMNGTIKMPGGEDSEFGAHATVTTQTDGGGDADISIPVLGKGGAAYNGGGAGAGARSNAGGGGGGGGGCFVAGTLVATNNGFKKIEDIQIGDIVLSYNEQTMQNEYSEVIETMIHHINNKIYILYIEDDKLEVTGIHRFLITYNNQREWIHAADLQIGDQVLFADGTLHEIYRIDEKYRLETVYNFEVSNTHNYYVGKNRILTHNKGCFIAGTPILMNGYYKNIENVERGDIVLSYNEELKKNEYSKVVQTMTHIVNENIYTLHIEDEQIVATGIHPFLIIHNGVQSWTIASELKEGDLVLFADGSLHQISKIEVEVKFVTVYNFEVAGNHNYYVGMNQVLAHNKGRGGRGSRPQYGNERKASKLNANDEIDRYHKLNNQLENLNKQYEKIDTIKNRLYGKAKIAKIDEEIAKQDEIIAKQKEYLKAVEANMKIDEEALRKSNKNTVKQYNEQQAKVDKLDKQYQEALKKDPKGKKKKTKNLKKQLQSAQNKLNKIDTTGLASYDRADGTKGFVSASVKDYLGMDAQIQDGVITNYEQLRKADIAKYNAAMDKYNVGIDQYNAIDQSTEKGKKKAEELKKQLEANKAMAEAQHEQFLKLIEQYEETQDLLEEKKKEVLDAQIEKMNLQLEKVTYTVEVQIDVHNDELEYLDFLMERLGDHVGNTAEKFGILANKMKNLSAQNDIYTSGIAGIFSNHANVADLEGIQDESSGYLNGEEVLQKLASGDKATFDMLASRGDFTQEEVDRMTEYVKGKIQNALSFRETKDQLFRELDEIFSKMTEKMDNLLDKQAHYQQELEHYYNIINIVGKKTLGITDDIAKKMDESRLVMSKTNANMAKKELDTINKAIEEQEAIRAHNEEKMQEALKNGQTSLAKEYQHNLDIIDETLTNMYSKQMEVEENYWSSLEAAAEAATTKYANEVDRTIQRFADVVAKGFRSIENLQTAFDRYVNTHKTYVEDYEKVYRLEKMTRDLQKDIDESNNVKIKEQYLKLQEEINKASEKGVKVSEYDLQLMERKREVLEAQQKLEDAQKAKTQVSLTRDNEGNYGYVYTADANDVAEAEQNYSDKIYEMRKLNAEYINELQQQLIQLNANMANDIQQLKDRLEINSDEYKAELARIKKDYEDQEADIYQQLQKALGDSTEINTEYAATYAELTGDRLALEINYVDEWKETVMGQLMKGYATLEDYQKAWTSSYIDLYKDVSTAAEVWQEDQAYVLDLSKDTLAEYGEYIDERVDGIQESSQRAEDAMAEMAAQTEEYMSNAADAVHNLGDDYTTEAQRMLDEADALADQFLKLKAAWADIKGMTKVQTKEVNTSDKDNKKNADKKTKDEDKKNKKKSKDEDKKNKTLHVGDRVKFNSGQIHYSSWGALGDDWTGHHGETFTINGYSWQAGIGQYNINLSYKGSPVGWVSASQISKLKTGGYTGQWGSEGKLAVLHEKELVLNKEDTQNLLDSVDIIRQISDTIDLNALSASGALSNISAGMAKDANNELDQHVEITANFPNATSREEIQAAFENLVGMASQYANRS